MLAIPISRGFKPARRAGFRGKHAILKVFTIGSTILLAFRLFASGGGDSGDSGDSDRAKFAPYAEKVYRAAKGKYEAATNDLEAAWRLGRACYDWADCSTTDKQRAAIAQEGIDACRKAIEVNPESVQGHYYLAMDLGQLAETKSLGALRLVSQMEVEFKKVLTLDEKHDYAGADRGLGLLYLEAPGWPTSIGSKSKAKAHLQKAFKIAPEYPENVLNVIEAELKWNDRKGAARDMDTLNAIWEGAKGKFKGEEWGSSWADWEKRKAEAEKKLEDGKKAAAGPRK